MEHGQPLHTHIPLADFSNFQFVAVLGIDEREGIVYMSAIASASSLAAFTQKAV
jgi:hypothetical protein